MAAFGVVEATSKVEWVQSAPMSDLVDQELFDEGALWASGGPHRAGASGIELNIPVVSGIKGSEFKSSAGNSGATAAA
jgi:hypothetical protein